MPASARDVSRGTAEMVRAPNRMLPCAAAAKYLKGESGDWSSELTPYIVEPLDAFSGREYQGIVFVGPARTGKTFGLILGAIAYIVTCAPADMMVVHTTETTARDFSKLDLDKALRHSDELRSRLSPRARDDNVFDKMFRSGMTLKIGWPSNTQLASKTLRYVVSSDYDRREDADNVSGEGSLWGQGSKRVETFMSRGRMLAESSPGRDIKPTDWIPQSPHEAPPCDGILGLYNLGTRARWYWRCQHCYEFMQARPGLDDFGLPDFDELLEEVKKRDLGVMAEHFGRIKCPKCQKLNLLEHKPEMNASGIWLHDGQVLKFDGTVEGERRNTNILSVWLGGAAAAYQTWNKMVLGYLQAMQTYARTSNEADLRKSINTDFAAPYMPRIYAKRRRGEDLTKRREFGLERGVVPLGVRYLTAAADVQGNRFVVAVFGWGVEQECWIIDRFSILLSQVRMIDGKHPAPLQPPVYLEDWMALADQVVRRKYPLVEAPSLHMSPRITLCDASGSDGVTFRALEFWRQMRDLGLGTRFMLCRGASDLNAPRVAESWPDSQNRSDRHSGSVGDVPVWRLNTVIYKDALFGDLDRTQPGPGYVHLPAWMSDEEISEYTSEQKDEKGRYIKLPGRRNEGPDLHGYNRAAVTILGAEEINWQQPPAWAIRPTLEATKPAPLPAPTKPTGSSVRVHGRSFPRR